MNTKWILVALMLSLYIFPQLSEAQNQKWKIYYDCGVNSFKQGKYAKAEKYFWIAVKYAIKEDGASDKTDNHLSQSLANLIETSRRLGNMGEVDVLNRWAIKAE